MGAAAQVNGPCPTPRARMLEGRRYCQPTDRGVEARG
jgi:hypothetical protein